MIHSEYEVCIICMFVCLYVCMCVGRCWGWMVSVVWGSGIRDRGLGIGKEKRDENLRFIARVDFIRNKRAFQQINLTLSVFFKRVTFDSADIF